MMSQVLYMLSVIGAAFCLIVLGFFLIATWTEMRRYTRRQR